MPLKLETPAGGGLFVRAATIALVAIGLIALASISAAPAYALVVSAPTPRLADPEEEGESLDEGEEGEFDCEQFERELEEEGIDLEEPCEGDEEGEGEGEGAVPPECILRTVSARVFTQSHNRVSLVLGYTSSEAVKVTIDYRLKGAKGALRVGRATRRFSRQGVLRLTDKLSDSQMAKVMAARSFDVSLRVHSAPSYCSSHFVRHLTSKRKAHGQLVWGQPKAGARKG